MKKFLSFCMLFLWTYEGNASAITNKEWIDQMDETKRIEFAFALLPHQDQMDTIQKLAATAQSVVEAEPKQQDILSIMRHYQRQIVRIPHVSIGQYAMLGLDLEQAQSIIDRASKKFMPITLEMNRRLVATGENVFFDAAAIRAHTNPHIIELYRHLREDYFQSIATRAPIDQALLEKSLNKDDPKEVDLIEKFFQNWGTPEDNRIRPHFTLIYNHCADQKRLDESLQSVDVPSNLGVLHFSRLGLLAIDFWGNPTHCLYEQPLKQ